MPITFQGAPYPADPARLTVDNNFTTRPTSSGVGTLSANSLITRTDGDTRYLPTLISRLTSDVDNATTTLIDTGLSVDLSVGVWEINTICAMFSQDFSTEPGFRIDPVTTGTMTPLAGVRVAGTNNTSGLRYRVNEVGGIGTQTVNAADAIFEYQFTVNVSVAGILKFQFRQLNTSTKYIRLQRGSYIKASFLP